MSQNFSSDSRFLIASSQGPRDEQQDSGICLHNDAGGTALLVVGDGVGGRSGGRIASQKVTQMASELWAERNGQLSNPEEDLTTLCQVAHEHINSEGSRLGLSPRTTIVALYLTPNEAHWVHSGDSRLYHFRSGQLVERTEDHSLLEIMVQRGAVKEEDMGNHPDQGTLLQALGGEEFTPPSSGTAAITPDDGFLLCTDGFWERTKPEEMLELMAAARPDAGAILDRAVARAVERNGPRGDNVTVLIALPARQSSVARVQSPVRRLALAAVLCFAALGVFVFCLPGQKKGDATISSSPSAKPEAPAPASAAAAAPTQPAAEVSPKPLEIPSNAPRTDTPAGQSKSGN